MLFAVTMTRDITKNDSGSPPWTLHQTQRSNPMGPVTHWPCPIKVSDVVVKCHQYVGVVFWFMGKAMVNYHEGIHTLPCILNILKH